MSSHLLALVRELDVNLLILLENDDFGNELIPALNSGTSDNWFLAPSMCAAVRVVTRIPLAFVRAISESDRYSIREVELPGVASVILALVHLRSKIWNTPESQLLGAKSVVDAIEEVEEKCGHARTVVAGDFNMDPFENGMLMAGGFHAMLSLQTVSRMKARVVEKRRYGMFYNPMWSIIGSNRDGPLGTYHYWHTNRRCQEWHVFDQVIVRPALIDCLPADNISILTRAGSQSLISVRGKPTPSDHLPLFFSLLEPKGSS